MTVVFDPVIHVMRAVKPCRSCGKPVYFSYSEKGKKTPYEVDEQGSPTRTNHFETCTDPKRWSKKKEEA